MNLKIKIFILLLLVVPAAFLSCKDDKADGTQQPVKETILSGEINLLVDNSLQPIAEDVLAVFHNIYPNAHITQINKTDREVVESLHNNVANVAIMPRQLTDDEEKYFKDKKITPKATQFATDAIAFITNTRSTDTVIDIHEIINVLQGKESSKISRLVFDDVNSGTAGYLLNLAGAENMPNKGVFSVKSNEEVIKYIHDNAGAIGVIGVNWLLQPPPKLLNYVKNIRVLAVNNVKSDDGEKKYYKPSQSNIATGLYPLTRKVYVLNYQGKKGLGMGFATYISAFDGQRIILKSGLLPVKIPSRQISIRNEL